MSNRSRDVAAGYLLVVFELQEDARPPEQRPKAPDPMEPLQVQLEREIERLGARLRETVEQHESSMEELKASNEELQAMNEELRSATEELETGREELQSINEELGTVNQELKLKVDELGSANSDMLNLMDATAIPTVFLDRDLRITRYTPSAVDVFNLISTDVGRPLTDLRTQLDYPTLGAGCVTRARAAGAGRARDQSCRQRPGTSRGCCPTGRPTTTSPAWC